MKMKFTALLFLLVFLVSCGTESVVVEETSTPPAIEQVADDIDAELGILDEELDDEEELIDPITGEVIDLVPVESTQDPEGGEASIDASEPEAKVQKVQAQYKNPKQEVYIDMEYSLDANGKISSIDMIDTNYDQGELQKNLQVLIGKSIDEIDETYISGGSLTIPAVKEALSGNA